MTIGFLDPKAPKKLMPRLNQLLNRAGITLEEVNMLRGIAKSVEQSATAAKALPKTDASSES
jgi:tRNA/rRNA methyltransferase